MSELHKAEMRLATTHHLRPVNRDRASSWIANGLVYGMLLAIFVMGHRTSWTLPKLSEWMGNEPEVLAPICSEHLVPIGECIECEPELWPRLKSFGYCKEHGVFECVLHHPELAQVLGDVPLPKYDTVTAIQQFPRREADGQDVLHEKRVQFASQQAFDKTGIEVDFVREAPMSEVVKANGELIFDPTFVAHITSRSPGIVAAGLHAPGDEVSRGDLLGLVESHQVGQIKTQYLQALVQYQLRRSAVDRMSPIVESGAVPQKSFLEAQSALKEAEVQLTSVRLLLSNLGFQVESLAENADHAQVAEQIRFLDIPPEVLESLPPDGRTANLLPIRSPTKGVIVSSHMVPGEVVDTSTWLLTVCDPTKMWLIIHLRIEDAKFVQPGQEVRFRDEFGAAVSGRIRWISPSVDDATRTIHARVPIENASGRLRDQTFVSTEVILRQEPNAIVVPRDAVQSTIAGQFVFVRDRSYFDPKAPKFFHVRQVRTGAVQDDKIELLAGAVVGEVVATRGSQSMMAQLFRGSIGSECGCFE